MKITVLPTFSDIFMTFVWYGFLMAPSGYLGSRLNY